MLLSHSRSGELPEGIDSIHNYYEHLVFAELASSSERCQTDREFFADCACVALNRLPPRYIRHNVDMSFFMSQQDMEEIQAKVRKACSEAVGYVIERTEARES